MASGTYLDTPAMPFDQVDTTITATALLVTPSGDHGATLAGVADDPIGVSYLCDSLGGFGTSGDGISVLMLRGGVERPFTAAGAITQGAQFYRAASGKVSTTAVGRPIGIAKEAASGNGSIFTGLCYSTPMPSDPHKIADPGNAGAIAVTKSGVCNITTAGSETRTLAIPTFDGQRIGLCIDVDGGTAVVTVASTINQTGNNTITMAEVDDFIYLLAVRKAGVLRWTVVANDGAALSTV